MVRFRAISQRYSRWVWGFFEKVKPHLWPLWHLTFYSYKRTICSLLESILFLLASFQGWYLLCFPGTLCPTRGLAIPSRSIRSEWVPPCHPARVWLRPRTTRGRWYRTKPILPVSKSGYCQSACAWWHFHYWTHYKAWLLHLKYFISVSAWVIWLELQCGISIAWSAIKWGRTFFSALGWSSTARILERCGARIPNGVL